MKKQLILVAACCCLMGNKVAFAQSIPNYRNATLTIEARTADLLERMTPDEKIGQLLCPLGWEMYDKQNDKVAYANKFEALMRDRKAGMLWATFRADPWTKKTLLNGLTPAMAAHAANALQRYAIEHTRLGIPLLLAEEAPHGHMAIGTTVFPTGIGQAATWNPMLLEQMGKAIAREIRLQGGHISYGPVIDLARDPRWSRVEETFGEDPVLTAKLGAAVVKGLGQGNLRSPSATVATLKHFLAYGIPEGGHNGNAVVVGERELHESFLPPFEAAINAGARSVMSSYNSIDGIPCTANPYLFTDLLRGEWKFNGFAVSDLGSIEGLHGSHRVAHHIRHAAIQALQAGIDVDLGGNAFPHLLEALERGEIDTAAINRAVARVLAIKFEMGLFENPYIDPEAAAKGVKTAEHIAIARRLAQESIILLENRRNILPLKLGTKVAIVGPNADNRYNQLGDYTAPQDETTVVTVRQGIEALNGSNRTRYAKGCAIRDTAAADASIAEAVVAAQASDVVVAVVGGSSARDFETEYIETGAAIASRRSVSDMDCGEGFDRATLALLGRQHDLLKALKATGKPLIVVYIQGRPLDMNWPADEADALLCAWYPGQEGGHAIADVLFGRINPAGRLPISVPRSVGQLPIHYNRRVPAGHNYVELDATPRYAFGYGKSYTSFAYSDLRVTRTENGRFDVTLTVTNTGPYDGDEVVQLYLRTVGAAVVQPDRQLKHFERIHLKKGEQRTVSFALTDRDFAHIGRDMRLSVDPSASYALLVGSSSDDIRLQSLIEPFIAKKLPLTPIMK